MKAAKDTLKMSPSSSKFGKNLDSAQRAGGVRNPKEVTEWNPLDSPNLRPSQLRALRAQSEAD